MKPNIVLPNYDDEHIFYCTVLPNYDNEAFNYVIVDKGPGDRENDKGFVFPEGETFVNKL